MGIDNIAFYGDMAGFGHPTGIDLPHEKEGIDALAAVEAAQLTGRSGTPEKRPRWPSGRAR